MASKTSIFNRALRILGGRSVQSPDENLPDAIRMNEAWDDCVDEVLRAHPWSHAMQWASLAKLATPPPFGFAYAYELPSACLRMVDIRTDGDLTREGQPFEIVGSAVYTNATPALARFVVRTDSTSLWPSDFCGVLALRLAVETASALAKDGGKLAPVLLQRYQLALDAAKLTDAACMREVDANREADNPFLKARFG